MQSLDTSQSGRVRSAVEIGTPGSIEPHHVGSVGKVCCYRTGFDTGVYMLRKYGLRLIDNIPCGGMDNGWLTHVNVGII